MSTSVISIAVSVDVPFINLPALFASYPMVEPESGPRPLRGGLIREEGRQLAEVSI